MKATKFFKLKARLQQGLKETSEILVEASTEISNIVEQTVEKIEEEVKEVIEEVKPVSTLKKKKNETTTE